MRGQKVSILKLEFLMFAFKDMSFLFIKHKDIILLYT